MSEQKLRRVAIIGGVRTPFCRAYTGYRHETNLSLMAAALGGLAERFRLGGEQIGEVMGGAVINHTRDFNLAREALLDAGFHPSTPGTNMQMACGTSLQAALTLGAKIAIGEIDSGIAVGSDIVSDAPVVAQPKLAHRLADLNRARSLKERLGALKGFSLGEIKPLAPSVTEPRTGLSMGEHCELMAQQWQIGRADQDALALASHQRAVAAHDSGFLDDLLVSHAGIVRDNNVRADTSLEILAAMKPAFDRRSGLGTLTAGNSTPLSDGAAAVLLASETWAKAHNLPILAYLSMGAVSANDFAAGDGLLMAPTIAVSRLLERSGLSFADFDIFEIHEAFAAQVLATLKAFSDRRYNKSVLGCTKVLGRIPAAKINLHGSSIAYGHPFAATGARILAATAKILAEKGKKRALISVCTAGGMGVAAIVERT